MSRAWASRFRARKGQRNFALWYWNDRLGATRPMKAKRLVCEEFVDDTVDRKPYGNASEGES